MTKKKLSKEVTALLVEKYPGINAELGPEVVEMVLEAIKTVVARDKRLEIRGFGSFSVVRTPSRVRRNPNTGAAVNVAASNKVKFKASKTLNESA